MFTVTKRCWNFLSADDRGFTFRGSNPKLAVQHVTDSDKLGETMQLQFKIKYKCSMLVGRRYKLVTGMGKAFDLEF